MAIVNGPCTAPRLLTTASKTSWSSFATWSLLLMLGSLAMIVPLMSFVQHANK